VEEQEPNRQQPTQGKEEKERKKEKKSEITLPQAPNSNQPT